jgi:MFS family permease
MAGHCSYSYRKLLWNERYAKNYGLVFTAYGVAAIIGGFASALITSTTRVAVGATFLDAYRPFFLVVAALAALGLVVAFTLLKPPVKKTA